MKKLLPLAVLALALPLATATALAEGAHADRAEEPSILQHFDVEVDPLAYVAQGHSLHLGFRLPHVRFDLGSFSLVVPEFVHGQSGFENQAGGFGVKLDAYLLQPDAGPFVGADGNWFEQQIIDESSHELTRVSSLMAGARFGWEIPMGAGFYARPWVGLNYRFGNDVITLPSGRTFRQSAFGVFPTVHVGYVFQ
jgi:hypothetical protein